jgi:WD40 repeat protein
MTLWAGMLEIVMPRRRVAPAANQLATLPNQNPAYDKKVRTSTRLKSGRPCSAMTNRLWLVFLMIVAVSAPARAESPWQAIEQLTSRLVDAIAGDPPEVERRLSSAHDIAHELVALAWSPGGSILATGSFGNVIALWDARSGSKLREFHLDNPVPLSGNSLAFTKDGRYLLTPAATASPGGEHAALTLWDVSSGSLVRQISGPLPDKDHRFNIARSFALSPDGGFLALLTTRDPGDPVALYETDHWNIVETLTVGKTITEALAFSPDSKQLAVGTVGGDIVSFDVRTGRRLRVIEAFRDPTPGALGHPMVIAIAFSPDGRMMAAASTQGYHFSVAHPLDPSTPPIPPDPIRIWHTADGSLVRSYFGKLGDSWALSWSAGGADYLVSTSDDRMLRFWDISSPSAEAAHDVRLQHAPLQIAHSPDGKHIAVNDGWDVLIIAAPTQ